MKNITPIEENQLVDQRASDLKIRLKRSDIFDLALHEAKGQLERAFEAERQRCVRLRGEVKYATGAIESEVRAILKKRYAKLLRAFRAMGSKDQLQIEVSYQTLSHPEPFLTRRGEAVPTKETRPSYLMQLRSARSRLGPVVVTIGQLARYNDSFSAGAFHARLPPNELGEISAIGRLEETVTALEQACDRLDFLKEEITAFHKRTVAAKQQLMKRILETSENGRSILELAKGLAREIDLVSVPPKVLPATVEGA